MYRYPWLSIDENSFVGKIKSKKSRASFINWGCYIADEVEIGQGVLIGANVSIVTSAHGLLVGVPVKDQKVEKKKVVIGDHVWIGAGATILGGNVIKDGAVIGAGAVLTEDHLVGENEIWAGNPAKLIKVKK